MNEQSMPRIQDWPLPDEKIGLRSKGISTVICLGLFFVFSTLGLSLLYLSQVYLKTSGYRKNSLVLDYSSENGIKKGFNYLLGLMGSRTSLPFLTEEHAEELKADAQSGGARVAEETISAHFPLLIEETSNEQAWRSETRAALQQMTETADSFAAIYELSISSEGMMVNFRPKKQSTLETEAKILVGHIPLAAIPLLIDKILSPEEKESFLSRNQIILVPPPGSPLQPQASFSDNNLIPSEAGSLLAEALKIGISRPQDLSVPRLRAALGLEPSADPVPEGIYLVHDDLGLGGIYIEGDLDEMVLAIDGDLQVISFRQGEGLWRLAFSPSRAWTRFSTPEGNSEYDLLPKGIIVVNGKVASLGGGQVDEAGNVALVKDRELPSILRGVDLTIVSSDEIAISSHLILQGASWEKGIPYVKDSTSQLIIYSTGQDFYLGTAREGGITVDAEAPREIKIQATLTARGAGFTVAGEGKEVEVLGSLQASDYSSSGNKIKVNVDERLTSTNGHLENSARTSVPVEFLASFRILGWREY